MPEPAGPTIDALIASAAPSEPRPLSGLITRLSAAGLLRGAREGGRAIGPAALGEVAARDVTEDSRAVRPGMLFVAGAGLHVDGHDYLSAAAGAGAAAAIVERPAPDIPLPQLVVDRSPAALAE